MYNEAKTSAKEMLKCPRCGSEKVVKNGHIHNGKAKFACKECKRQFVESPQMQPISDATKALIDKLLLERISLAGIARATRASKRWLQTYVNAKYDRQPQLPAIPAQKNAD